ncbi:lysylphosphatidylglycerol synthase transmembrane domain-containing protein [Marinimicrococcus flavescens]|uniref:Lysylphosphatidylglycerol synthase transmembrane domain-containing protein n=1 Tax=Marinimicrococcus flavescens TaxID=3031815 RepID=A0AAP3XS31_9PROT|nr:lysylphosphatidylglycerol synthase transmembrane domain-containing protein [Marinimicrococcus flavescens]
MTDVPMMSGPAPSARSGKGKGPVWLKLGVTVVVLGILLWTLDVSALPGLIAGADVRLLGLLLASLFVERVFAAYRWWVLLRPNAPGLPFAPVLRISFISNYLGAFMPGGVGIDMLRVWGLSRHASDLPLALSSIVVERIFGLAGMFALIPVGLLMAPVGLPREVEILLMLAAGGLVLASIALYLQSVRRLARRLLLAVKPLHRLNDALGGITGKLDAYARVPWTLVYSALLGCVNQLLRAVSFVIGGWALGLSIDPGLLVAIVPIAILVALLPISFGGLGPREATFVGLLGVAGVAPAGAFALILVREALNLLTALPGAWLFFRHGASIKAAPAAAGDAFAGSLATHGADR